MLTTIVSGYQTGADRGGVHAAYDFGLETGGWIPPDRRSEDGKITKEVIQKYKLKLHPGGGYRPRTEQNVKDSDATVLFGNMDSPGCRLTRRMANHHSRPFLCNPAAETLEVFLRGGWKHVRVLNVAGNREESNPGIYQSTYDLITAMLKGLHHGA